jgi:transposase InsO family protein
MNRSLLADVRRIHQQHRVAMARRIHAALQAEGRSVSRGRIERLMRRHGIRAATHRRFRVVTTDSNHGLPVADNLLGQTFLATRPNEIWLADISYIPTDEGWLYLAVVLDLFTRKVVGWAMRDHLCQELTIAALTMAIQRQRPARGLLHHSDRGSQYAAGDLPRVAESKQHRDVDEPEGQVLVQCADGNLVPHPQNRVGSPRRLCDPPGGQA